MIDLAVGIIIGASFGKIVASFVADILMPIIGILLGKVDFSNLFVVLGSVPDGINRMNGQSAINTLLKQAKVWRPVLFWQALDYRTGTA